MTDYVSDPHRRAHTRSARASSSSERFMAELLSEAGIRLGGHRPWDIRLIRPGVPEQVFARANLGLGETYMDGDWECDRLDMLFHRLLRAVRVVARNVDLVVV